VDDFATEGLSNLRQIQATLQLSAVEAAVMFGVTRQALTKWFKRGVPASRAAKVDRIALVVTQLAKRFRSHQIPRFAREGAEEIAEPTPKVPERPDASARG
jgi:hypothetical protein